MEFAVKTEPILKEGETACLSANIVDRKIKHVFFLFMLEFVVTIVFVFSIWTNVVTCS